MRRAAAVVTVVGDDSMRGKGGRCRCVWACIFIWGKEGNGADSAQGGDGGSSAWFVRLRWGLSVCRLLWAVAEVAIKGNSDYTIIYSPGPLSSSCTTNNPQPHSTNPLSRSQSLIALSPLLIYNSRLNLACMDNAENSSSSDRQTGANHYAYHQLYPVSEATAQCRPR